MNIDEILNTWQISEQHGHSTSIQEAMILYNSLLILQNENHFHRIFFWGRISAVECDYFIVFGYTKDILLNHTYYYSTDCINWGLLPRPTADALWVTPLCISRFQGDPALVSDVLILAGDSHTGVEQTRRLKEEDRLAATVHLITTEAALLPRGGLLRRPDGITVENLGFCGLSVLDAKDIKNFQHFRLPTRPWNVNLLTKDDHNYAIDFLDPISIDMPEGCWTIQFCDGERIVTLKYLYWPGMIFYHYCNSPRHGFIYFGNGRKTMDVPFYLNIDKYKQICS